MILLCFRRRGAFWYSVNHIDVFMFEYFQYHWSYQLPQASCSRPTRRPPSCATPTRSLKPATGRHPTRQLLGQYVVNFRPLHQWVQYFLGKWLLVETAFTLRNKSVSSVYSCYVDFFGVFDKGKILKYSLLLAVLLRKPTWSHPSIFWMAVISSPKMSLTISTTKIFLKLV